MKKLILCGAVAAMLAGCVTPHPPMSREEYIATTTRVYPDKTKEDVFKAAEKLFRLSDGNDYTFTHSEESMDATRKWSFYVVLAAGFGQDHWRVTAKDTDNGVKATVQAATQSQAVQPMMVADGTNQNAYATTGPMQGSPIQGNALYNLFWKRMDYLLGKRPDWATCEESDKNIKEGKEWGFNDPLCNSFNVDDVDPTKPKKDKQDSNIDIE